MKVNKRPWPPRKRSKVSNLPALPDFLCELHGWDAQLHKQREPVPGWPSSRSPVGTCFPEEPPCEQRSWQNDHWTAKRLVCTVMSMAGLQNSNARLMTESTYLTMLYAQTQRRGRAAHACDPRAKQTYWRLTVLLLSWTSECFVKWQILSQK